MAQTFEAAFAAVGAEGLILDASTEEQRSEHRESDPAVAAAISSFGAHAMRSRTISLAHTTGVSVFDAEEAMQDALLGVLLKEPERFLVSDWMAWVFNKARYTARKGREGQGSACSIEALTEDQDGHAGGDGPLHGARSVVAYTPAGVDEDARYAPPPAKGEKWTELQVIGAFQRFRDRHGRPPKSGELGSANELPSSYVVKRLFDNSVNAAILASGMVPTHTSPRTHRWTELDTAQEVLRFRRRYGFWPNGSDTSRWGQSLPSREAMRRYLGGESSHEVQRGAEEILGPIDHQADPDGKLTARLRAVWEAARSGANSPQSLAA